LVVAIGIAAAGIAKFVNQTREAKKSQEEFNKTVSENQADFLVQKYGQVLDSRQKILQQDKQIKESGDQQVKNAIRLFELEKKRNELMELAREFQRAGDEVHRKAYQSQINLITEEVQAIKKETEGNGRLTDSQQAVVDAQKAIADGFKIIQEKSELAKLSGEAFNIEEQKRALVTEQINNLIDKQFAIEGSGIQAILSQYGDLLALDEEQIRVIEARIEARDKEMSAEEYYNLKSIEDKEKILDIEKHTKFNFDAVDAKIAKMLGREAKAE